MIRAATLSLLSVLLVLLVGCGSSLLGGSSSGASEAEVADLKRRLLEAQRQHAVDEVELGRLRQEVARLERELDEVERRALDAERRAERDASRPLPPVRDSAPIESADLEPEPPPVAASPSVPPPSAPPPSAPPAVGDDAQALYDQGYTLFHRQRYAEAQERFEAFLMAHPDTDLSDNAQFWIGECHFARADYRSALDAFIATVERYPEGNKRGDAMVKAGKCLEALGDLDEAIATYREVVSRFAGSAASAIAEERLEALEQGSR